MNNSYYENEYTNVYTDPLFTGYESWQEIENIKTGSADRWCHDLVSKVAYLLGIDQDHFNEDKEFIKEVYDQMSHDKSARIVRNLCILRTILLKNRSELVNAMYYDFKNLHSMPDLVPQNILNELECEGVSIEKPNHKLNSYTIDINRHLMNWIGDCKKHFPSWINWQYVKELFIMPNGLKNKGVNSASRKYHVNYLNLPFHVYMNWNGTEDGPMLLHDGRFVQKLYSVHNDCFTDLSKVRDASERTKTSIYDFIKGSSNASIIVDCEYSDPYKLYAVLKNLDQKELLDKIFSIVLFDDFHTSDAWRILEEFTQIPVRHKQVDRIKENKSLVDQTLMITATKMALHENIDSFILVASDSDYWALMKELPTTHFLVMMEYGKCGPDIKNAMNQKGISYCFIDDFCTGNICDIKERVFIRELRKRLEGLIKVDLCQLIENSVIATRMNLNENEKEVYLKRIRKELHTDISDNGLLSLKLC